MRFCRFCLQKIASLFKITITDEKWNVCEQFIKFALVGCSNAVVTLIIYNIIVFFFGEGCYIVGQTLGYIAGIINSYFWNSRLVFENTDQPKTKSFFKMFICYLVTYFLQIGLLYAFVNFFKLSAFISPILAILITTPINFIINKLWAFNEHKLAKK